MMRPARRSVQADCQRPQRQPSLNPEAIRAETAPMMRIVLVALLLSIGGCGSKRAAGPWETIELGTDASFEDVCFADTLNGWIVGGSIHAQGGIVGRTRDGGRTWAFTSGIASEGPGTVAYTLNAVYFADTLNGLVAGEGGRIFKSEDGGRNWRLVEYGRGGASHFFDLEMRDPWNGWAIGLMGVMKTTDGGETWVPLTRPGGEDEPTWGHAAAFVDEVHGFKVGQYGVLEFTTNGGRRWYDHVLTFASNPKPYLFDVHFADPQHGWVVGEDGTVFRTVNGGASWEHLDTGLSDAKERPRPPGSVPGPPGIEEIEGPLAGLFLTRVFFIDERRGWAVGFWSDQGRSVVLGTTDGGDSWKIEAEAHGEELRAFTAMKDGRAWALGDRSREGAQTLLLRSAVLP